MFASVLMAQQAFDLVNELEELEELYLEAPVL